MSPPFQMFVMSDAPPAEVSAALAAMGMEMTGQIVAIGDSPQGQPQPPAYSTLRGLPHHRADQEDASLRIAYLEAKIASLYAEQNMRAVADDNQRLRDRVAELLSQKEAQAEVIGDMHKQLSARDAKPAKKPAARKAGKKNGRGRKAAVKKTPLTWPGTPAKNGVA